LYKGHDIGVIAQEVEEVLPEIVDTREDGHKAVKYDRMVALLIEAVKEQQQQINELKEKLNG
jgi:predicted small metal-binding protein